MINDWATVAQGETPMARVLLALQRQQDMGPVLLQARRDFGTAITANEYHRAYQPILQLHMLHEVELIHRASIPSADRENGPRLTRQAATDLIDGLSMRFLTTSPTFRVREAILSIRRTAFGLVNSQLLAPEIGRAWILSSKIARKAGYEQTAYSATLQAKEAEAPFAFVQQAKVLRANGGALRALTDLEHALQALGRPDVIDITDETYSKDRTYAKVCTRRMR